MELHHRTPPTTAQVVILIYLRILSRKWRLAGVGAIGEKAEDKESEQKDENYGLKPAFGQKKAAFGGRAHRIDSSEEVWPRFYRFAR